MTGRRGFFSVLIGAPVAAVSKGKLPKTVAVNISGPLCHECGRGLVSWKNEAGDFSFYRCDGQGCKMEGVSISAPSVEVSVVDQDRAKAVVAETTRRYERERREREAYWEERLRRSSEKLPNGKV